MLPSGVHVRIRIRFMESVIFFFFRTLIPKLPTPFVYLLIYDNVKRSFIDK